MDFRKAMIEIVENKSSAAKAFVIEKIQLTWKTSFTNTMDKTCERCHVSFQERGASVINTGSSAKIGLPP